MIKFILPLLLVVGQFAFSGERYPKNPDAHMTPGALCTHPDEYRYPEHIPYCERDVSTDTKWEVIADYDRELGYEIGSMNRGDFKIDHFIPLCAGGSNGKENLWPQHKSVYTITDKMEELACIKMKEGVLSQKEAIELIRDGKYHLEKVPEIVRYMHSK